MVSSRRLLEERHNMYVYLRQSHPNWSDKKIHMHMQSLDNKKQVVATTKGEYILVFTCIIVMLIFGIWSMML